MSSLLGSHSSQQSPFYPAAKERDMSCEDAKKLWSSICRKEELLDKKKRWLMGPDTASTTEGNQKRQKTPKFLTNLFVPESHIRSDEVSFDNVRTTVERSFGSSMDTHEGNHVVQDYLGLFDLHKTDPSNFLKSLSSIIDNFNNDALFLVSNIVTEDKISFVKTRPRMKKIIKEYLPKFLKEPALLQKLSQVFQNPKHFREKRFTLVTPITPSLLSAIHKALEELDNMPLQDLIAISKKLRGEKSTPQFPPKRSGENKDLLLQRVKKRFKKFLSALKDEVDLPEPLSKALSAICLSLKQRTRSVEVLTSEFFPFSPEIIDLQNDILRALWSLPKVKHGELRDLQALIHPDAEAPRKIFRRALKTYLLQCLFKCDEIENIPEDLLRTLAFINRRSRRQEFSCSKETMDEDIEAILNVSSQLRQVAPSMFLDCSSNESVELEGDGDSGSNDFDLSGNSFYSNLDGSEDKYMHRSDTNDNAEATGDSRDMITKEPKLEENYDINPHSSIEEPSGGMREIVVQEICDDVSLFSYRLVGSMLDKFLQEEGRDVDGITRYYLTGGSESSPPLGSQGTEDVSCTSSKETNTEILNRALDEILPSLPESCVERVKKLVVKP